MQFPHHPGHRMHCGPRGPRGMGRFGRHRGDEGPDSERGRRLFDSGELRLVVLKLVADEPRHGYDIIRAIETLTGGAYAPSPGVIYPTLTLLQDMGYIAETQTDGTRRAFSITAAGAAHLEERKDAVAALFARLAALAARQQKTDGAPIRRAMGNLRAVLMQRLGREDVTRDTLHDVAAILDEAAQKIERLL